jgi:mono/diheme cytochrome c family protein
MNDVSRTPRFLRWLMLTPLLLLLLVAAAMAIAWRPAIAALTDTGANVDSNAGSGTGAPRFDPVLVARGASLAAIGSCATCHSATPAQPFAGGLPLQTPFGTVYSTNITPDRETGIGTWTQVAFARAMREGVARDGHFLYPVFPYDHYTHLADGDIAALYAYLMTRAPAAAPPYANHLIFPLGWRPLLAGWNLLYLKHGAVAPDPDHDLEWNRGAYLSEALGHCGSCHTPRNALGAQDLSRSLAGGEAEGWYAPALNADSPSPLPWSVAQLTSYLRSGIAPDHAIAAGPMQGVTASLSQADERDVRALAVYIQSLMGTAPAARREGARQRAAQAGAQSLPVPPAGDDTAARQLTTGAAVYAGACARCHDSGRQATSAGALQMPLAVAVYDPDPRSLLHLIRDGVRPPPDQPGRWMPGFAAELSDDQQLALAAYLRQYAANLAPWPDLAGALKKVKTP